MGVVYSTFVAFVLLTIFFTFSTAQQYIITTSDITATWLDPIGQLTPYTVLGDIPTPTLQFNFMGNFYDILLHDYGSIHFGDRYSLAVNGCCNGSCTASCDFSSDTRQANLAIFPLNFPVWPSNLSFTHAVYSNSTTFAYRTVMNSSSGSYIYSVILMAPSTIIIGLDPNSANPLTTFVSAFSGIVGSFDSTFGTSPINDPTVDSGVNYPPATTYPSTTLISYPRSSYAFGKVYVFCAIGGNLCPQAYTMTRTLPLTISLTTNSDTSCYRNLNSNFLLSLLPNYISRVKPYPPLNCELQIVTSSGTNGMTIIVAAQYDTTTDTFLCTIPTNYIDPVSGSSPTAQLATASSLRTLTLSSTAAYPGSPAPFQPKSIFTPINYLQDWTRTSQFPEFNSGVIVTADLTQLGSVPVTFPYPHDPAGPVDVIPFQCHCQTIRYRGNAFANPSTVNAYQYGRSINAMIENSRDVSGNSTLIVQDNFPSTISDSFYTNDDYCFYDCTQKRQGDGVYNNCGQCVSLSALQIKDPAATSTEQVLNCWNMCDNLTMKNTGHFNYLNNLPKEARTNGLMQPNSPYHQINKVEISDTPLGEKEVQCAVRSLVVPMISDIQTGETTLDTLAIDDEKIIQSAQNEQHVNQSKEKNEFPTSNQHNQNLLSVHISPRNLASSYYTQNDYELYDQQHEHIQTLYSPHIDQSQFSTFSAFSSNLSTLYTTLQSQFISSYLTAPLTTTLSSAPIHTTALVSTQFSTQASDPPSGTVTGFTTERDHISETLNTLDGFKYFAAAFSVIGLCFAGYLVYDQHAREKRRTARREQRKNEKKGGGRPSAAIGGRPSAASGAASGALQTAPSPPSPTFEPDAGQDLLAQDEPAASRAIPSPGGGDSGGAESRRSSSRPRPSQQPRDGRRSRTSGIQPPSQPLQDGERRMRPRRT